MAKTPIIPPLPEEEHFEQELGAYNYIPNDEDDGTGENFPYQKASHDEDDNESMDGCDGRVRGQRETAIFHLDSFVGRNLHRSYCHDWLYWMEGV